MHTPCALSRKHTHIHTHTRRKESSVAEARLAGRAIRFVRRETSRRTRRRKRDGGRRERRSTVVGWRRRWWWRAGGGTREWARRDAAGGRRGTAEENAEVEVEEDNIDPLVAPPLLAQPTPSLYYPPSLRPSDICAHLRPRNPRDPLVHPRIALPRRYLFILLTENCDCTVRCIR